MEDIKTLASLIKSKLNKEKLTQSKLSEKIGCEPAYLSNVLNSNKTPSQDFLNNIASKLKIDLKLLLITANYEKYKKKPEISKAWKDILLSYNSYTSPFKYRTLIDFPEAFDNLVVICGDRREKPPKTIGDLFAFSASTIDLSGIHHLKLPEDTYIKSDKVFYLYKNKEDRNFKELREKYGEKNLLVIGSAAANLISREVNKSAVFRFNTNHMIIQRIEKMKKDIWEERYTPSRLQEYKEKHDNEIRRITRLFRIAGFIDPIIHGLQGFEIPNNKDFGVISIARNPFSDENDFEHLAILVAGVHSPGTIEAINFLSNKNNFIERPFGGIIEIDVPDALKYEDRFDKLVSKWQTKPYTKEKILTSLKELSEKCNAMNDVFITKKETENCINLIMEIINQTKQ